MSHLGLLFKSTYSGPLGRGRGPVVLTSQVIWELEAASRQFLHPLKQIWLVDPGTQVIGQTEPWVQGRGEEWGPHGRGCFCKQRNLLNTKHSAL